MPKIAAFSAKFTVAAKTFREVVNRMAGADAVVLSAGQGGLTFESRGEGLNATVALAECSSGEAKAAYNPELLMRFLKAGFGDELAGEFGTRLPIVLRCDLRPGSADYWLAPRVDPCDLRPGSADPCE